MLVRFKVKNFLSFEKITEFSMIKGKTKAKAERVFESDQVKLLKFSAIFGANASGKSNFVKAIDFAKNCIVNEIPNLNRDYYFKGDKIYETLPTYFEFEILCGEKVFSYGFELILSKRQIVTEWLIELGAKKEKVIFSRDLKNKKFETMKFGDRKLKERFMIYFEDVKTREDMLFLKEINRLKDGLYIKNSEILCIREVYAFFENKLIVSRSNNINSGYTYLLNDKNQDKIIETIQSFGTGIMGYKFIDVDFEKVIKDVPRVLAASINRDIDRAVKKMSEQQGFQNGMIANSIGGIPFAGMRVGKTFNILYLDKNFNVHACEMKLIHQNTPLQFDFAEESDGTQVLFDLLEIFFTKRDCVYVIDELDRSLHPQLTYKFVQMFLANAKHSNIQLIVTTHESRLLDFNLLRQDEIWLVDKNRNGASSMFSLDEYNVRYDKKVDKAYLEGRYGGVPIFSTIFPVDEGDE